MVANITLLGCTVVSMMTRLRSDGLIASVLGGDRKALLQHRLQLLLAPCARASALVRAVEHHAALEELLAAEELVIGFSTQRSHKSS